MLIMMITVYIYTMTSTIIITIAGRKEQKWCVTPPVWVKVILLLPHAKSKIVPIQVLIINTFFEIFTIIIIFCIKLKVIMDYASLQRVYMIVSLVCLIIIFIFSKVPIKRSRDK